MRKISTSTYLKALGIVALGLYFTNCAPKGTSPEAKLKAHCLESMDPKADFIATAESLSENAKIRIVTADYKETTLRDDMPLEVTTIDPNIFSEKPAQEAKDEFANDLLPEKFCGSHQVKLSDGTIARISSISKNHLEATWSKMIKTGDREQDLESMNSITYRYVIDPDTKHEHLEITEMNLFDNHKKMVKKDVYLGETLTKKVKLNASVIQALSNVVSPEEIRSTIPLTDEERSKIPGVIEQKIILESQKQKIVEDEKLRLTPLQMDEMQNQFKELEEEFTPDDVLEVDPNTVLNVDPENLLMIQDIIKTAKEKIKLEQKIKDIDQAEVRIGNPSVDKSVYPVEENSLKEDDTSEDKTETEIETETETETETEL